MAKPILTAPIAELMITARIRMERALYDRAKATADTLGLSVAEYVTVRLTRCVELDEALARPSGREVHAA